MKTSEVKGVLVSVDMEGCAAVAAPQALSPDRWQWEWQSARRWMTADAVASATGALAAGYRKVVLVDSHGNSHNIDPDALPEDVWLIRSWPRPLLHMQGIEDPEIDACVFIGYHAAANDRDAILAHTYSGAAFRSCHLNGVVCSEGYLNAAVAGSFGKPVLLVSGDQHCLRDAERYAPDAAMFLSKRSIGWRAQMSLAPSLVSGQLQEAVHKACSGSKSKPFVISGPFKLELDMTTQSAAEMLAYLPQVRRSSAHRVEVSLDSVEQVMRFVSFAILYTPSGVPAL